MRLTPTKLKLCSLPLLAWLASVALQAQPNCGKYAVAGNTCQRYATFAWYTSGGVWQSQVSVVVPAGAPGVATGSVTVQFGIGAGTNRGLLTGAPFSSLYGGIAGNKAYFSTIQAMIPTGGSARLDLESGAVCVGAECTQSSDLAVGAMWAIISSPDASALDLTTLQLIYLSAPVAGAQNTTQVAVPPVFSDLASSKWITTYSETPLEKKSEEANSNNMAFSVANLSDQAQAVTVSIYDLYGNLITSKSTPVLQGGKKEGAQVKPGDVYADSFANFFGLATSAVTNPLATAALSRTGTIDGTIIFQSSAGQPIAPLVVRAAGNSNSMMLLAPLP